MDFHSQGDLEDKGDLVSGMGHKLRSCVMTGPRPKIDTKQKVVKVPEYPFSPH